MHAGADAGYLIRAKALFSHRLKQRVGGGVRVPVGGVELERGLRHCPLLPEPLDQLRGIRVRGHPDGQPLISLQDAGRAGEPVAGEVGGEKTVGCGLCGVELLGVRRVAQELPQPGGLRPGRTERMEHDLFVSAQKVGDGGRGERARRPGRVEDLVVRTAEVASHPHPGLVAGHRGGDQVSSRGPGLLGCGEGGREDHGRRVENRGVVEVVLLDNVRRGAVHERGEERRGAPARDQDLARPFGRSHGLGESFENADRPRVLAGEGRCGPIEKQFLGALDDFIWQVFKA